MASPDDDMVKGFLLALESTMDARDKVSMVAGQLLAVGRRSALTLETQFSIARARVSVSGHPGVTGLA